MNSRPQRSTDSIKRGPNDIIRKIPSTASRPVDPKGYLRVSKKQLIVGSVVSLLAIALVAFYRYSQNVAQSINKSDYQAVFLDNGQVYFGKLSAINNQYFKLSDVYYFEADNTAQTSAETSGANTSSTAPQLIKLGKEIHGPRSEMVINEDQMLFFENITEDGAVGKAITSDKEKQ